MRISRKVRKGLSFQEIEMGMISGGSLRGGLGATHFGPSDCSITAGLTDPQIRGCGTIENEEELFRFEKGMISRPRPIF